MNGGPLSCICTEQSSAGPWRSGRWWAASLTSDVGWLVLYPLVNVPIGVVAVALTLAKVKESRYPTGRRIDWTGVVFFSVSLFTLVLGLDQEGNDDGWGSTKIVTLLVVSAITMGLFIVTELRVQQPMLDLTLFRRPAMTGVSVVAFTLAASVFALFLYITFYIQDGLGYGPLAAGLRFLPITVLAFIVAPIAGKLTVKVQSRFLLGIGLLLITGGLLFMGTTCGRRAGLNCCRVSCCAEPASGGSTLYWPRLQ